MIKLPKISLRISLFITQYEKKQVLFCKMSKNFFFFGLCNKSDMIKNTLFKSTATNYFLLEIFITKLRGLDFIAAFEWD